MSRRDWIKLFASSWEEFRMHKTSRILLKDLLITTKDGDWGKAEEQDGYEKYQVIRATDFHDVSVGDTRKVPVRFLNQKNVQRRTLEPGDILIETAGGSPGRPTGRTMIFSERVQAGFSSPVTCASFARFMRANSEIVDPRYLYWYLQSMYLSGEIEQYQVQHTGVARFQYTDFAASHLVPLPLIGTQQAIAEVLGALDDKIAANTKLADTADDLAKTMVRMTVTSLTQRLDEAANIVMGTSPKGSDLNENSEGIAFFQGVRDFGMRFPSRRVSTTNALRLAQKGDILLSVRAPVGEVNFSQDEVCIGRGLSAVRHKFGRQATLFHLLRHESSVWAPYEAEGTVFGSINKSQLHGILVPTVREDIASEIESKVGAIENTIAGFLAENELLQLTRDTLLPQLMSGKLSVRDAEHIAQQAGA
ncbi:hypothetical protein CQ010_02135 [Arthrobacter sp. MYb211]|uniref:restriction endonuclease subunit S n=2 Tax=Micrococcales TaxID=85006 RepID=UPI000CFB9F7B|nr:MULTISPECIES: restriction endonuclease subunit S [unclassified Arthrobacter]PRA02351.1 hypothetical protein CQ019_12845 [Arthrobacter sp. MYb229]PRA13466.1 hypothetical protein CQ015_04390 [Arthrobacter sp. MYb221]PRB50706.1 hypothetical protein CQ013_11980 [Arthrobacter sp. MYb216]PRC10665.1 hypothetical protein CQ010_02135 [Arthrobacter sp. MYb211]